MCGAGWLKLLLALELTPKLNRKGDPQTKPSSRRLGLTISSRLCERLFACQL